MQHMVILNTIVHVGKIFSGIQVFPVGGYLIQYLAERELPLNQILIDALGAFRMIVMIRMAKPEFQKVMYIKFNHKKITHAGVNANQVPCPFFKYRGHAPGPRSTHQPTRGHRHHPRPAPSASRAN